MGKPLTGDGTVPVLVKVYSAVRPAFYYKSEMRIQFVRETVNQTYPNIDFYRICRLVLQLFGNDSIKSRKSHVNYY